MRIPVPLAWLMLGLTFVTAALLRQFHDETPVSPLISPIVGSVLFAAILLLLLIAARERHLGAGSGPGVRLGSLAPIMLFLLVEKWISLSIYPLVFNWITPVGLDPAFVDATFRTFAGISLIMLCLVIGRLSTPTARKTWRRARPIRWPIAVLGTLLVLAGTYLVLGLLSSALGGGLRLQWPQSSPVLIWVVAGQGILALGEELYYRGLLMCEMERLAPRLGVRNPILRRWIALLSTSALFGMEHLPIGLPWSESVRQLVFAVALGLLFGILVMVSTNLHFVAGVHAWINWLLLGVAPHFVDSLGRPALPPGTYIGLTLALAFVLTYLFRRWRRGRLYGGSARVMAA